MKFLIQKINKEIRHDFSFTLLESIRFNKWLHGKDSTMKYKFLDTIDIVEPSDIYPPFGFKHHHYREKYVPIGSVDFVNEYLQRMYGISLMPINVPDELFPFADRYIFNGNHLSLENSSGDYFVKSNERIKGFAKFIECNTREQFPYNIPIGEYQISQKIYIQSEWRAFVYKGKLVGLQNYSGDFTIFPNIRRIDAMIKAYKLSPIAYSLDVGVNECGTFVIECHPMVSVGLYGFADHKILPHMFYKCFWELIKNEGKNIIKN